MREKLEKNGKYFDEFEMDEFFTLLAIVNFHRWGGRNRNCDEFETNIPNSSMNRRKTHDRQRWPTD